MKFIDRIEELKLLEDEYQRDETAFSVIYGRRRTGKTTLIQQFIQNKNAIYFFADTDREALQLRRFQSMIATHFNDPFLEQIRFDQWEPLFQYLVGKLTSKNKLVLVIDEFQYLCRSNRAFSAIFQRIFDTILKGKPIMVILCGSLISMIYSEVLSYSSPLYGRRTSQINLKQIPFQYYGDFFTHRDPVKLITAYGVTGGIPRYIEQLNHYDTLIEGIVSEILDKNRFLYAEPKFLLLEEVNEVSTYFSILEMIATGAHKLSEITGRIGVKGSDLTPFLKKLIDLDLLEKQIPITENPQKSKKGLYFIKDNFIKFWFRFVFPMRSYLEIGRIERVKQQVIDQLEHYTTEIFEQIVRESIYHLTLPFIPEIAGRWWSKHCEIDLMATGENSILLGECKWSKKHVGLSVLRQLKEKGNAVTGLKKYRSIYYALFSKSGFSDDLIEFSKKDETVLLFGLDELLERD